MNLLYVTDSPTVSGAEHVLLHYLEAWRPPHFRTHVFLRRSNTRLIEQLERRGIAFHASDSFSTAIIRTTARPADLAQFTRAFLGVRREMRELARTFPYQLVHSISYPTSLYVAMALGASVPHIWHEHNIKRIHAFNRPIYRWVADRCARVIGPSNAVVAALGQAVASSKLSTVYNGIDLSRFTPEPLARVLARRDLDLDDQHLGVALAGQLLPYKGHRALIEAASRLRDSLPQARYFIVGALENPPYEAELRAAIRAKQLEDRFVFTGWRTDMHAILQAMDVLVVPTETPEPAALGLMEAMALGQPLIASRTGGTPELVSDGETGLLFEPQDVAQFSAALLRLGTDAQLRHALGRAARARALAAFGLDSHLEEVERLYRMASS
ncbi:MAG: glycosyltransferase family 4 protein [Vicinamibacterales bacterium]